MLAINKRQLFLNKMKQSGIPANGIVTAYVMKHPYPEEHRQEYTEIFGERQAELTVQISYKTQENTAETIDMHTKDLSAYPVGTPVKVRYLCENGRYLAIPEVLLYEKKSPSLRDKNPGAGRKLRTVLLAAGVFVVSVGATVAVIWACLNL